MLSRLRALSGAAPAGRRTSATLIAGILVRRCIAIILAMSLAMPAFVPPAYAADVLTQQGVPQQQGAAQTGGGSNYRLQVSSRPDRSNGSALRNQAAEAGDIHVFVAPASGIRQVRFWLDPASTALEELEGVTPTSVATRAPFDMNGANAQNQANPLDTRQLADGPHRIVAAIELADGAIHTDVAEFVVQNGAPALVFGREPLKFRLPAGGSIEKAIRLVTTDGGPATFKLSSNVPWLSFEGTRPMLNAESGFAPDERILQVNTANLAPGDYTATITATADGFAPATSEVKLQISAVAVCSPVPCNQVMITLPYNLTWSSDHGKILDANGVGTGFTWVSQPAVGIGYIPANLVVDTAAGVLRYTTTAGIMNEANNSQDNFIGVGIDAPSQVTELKTTVLNVPAGTNNYEQAGLWFGNDQDNYVKLEVISWPDGMRIEYAMEVGGVRQPGILSLVDPTLAGANVELRLRANPGDRTVTAYYGVNGAAVGQFGVFTAPGEFFSFDAAGIDPEIGTRSFGGIFGTHRNGPAPITYTFGDFSVTGIGAPPPPSGFFFDRISYPIQYPSSMVFGPDGRLYVLEFMGTIHALTLNASHQVVADEVINTLSPRLALGITVDPASTASDVVLWVSHSSPTMGPGGVFLGEVNSGIITRLSGAGFATRQDVITGLPRALANHATNSIHFGPDGKLYIAQGGNTGAGAPNTANTEFGTRAEQPLSAAFLVADVKSPTFNGNCAMPEGSFLPVTCGVQLYSTGLRNMYDFVFHSNGQIYGPDNGLGVTGTYPPQPSPVCTGLANPALYPTGNNPGPQHDFLNRLLVGKYYGHPNPYRNECVFKDGSFQGVAPLGTFMAPMFDLGASTSSNGIVEFKGAAFNGALSGQLLITNYSVGDNIVRVKLSADGLTALEMQPIVAGLSDPLPLVQGPDGTLYVGEFGTGRVTALVPRSGGTWVTKAPLPVSMFDAGSGVIGNRLYLVAGKDSTGQPTRTLWVYDAVSDSWTSGPNLPAVYPAVENPAVAAYGGKLYVFSGSTLPFSGAVPNAAVFDPGTNSWSALANIPTPRGGATAQAIGNKIYVAGGMNGAGASLATMEIYDPATNTWATGPAMGTPRDNPGSAALAGKLYVFGGRTRLADGTELQPTLNTTEMFDPATNSWTPRANMPTGRRTMAVGLLNGRAQVMGGERTPTGATFSQNEEYDPITNTWTQLAPMVTPRHGAGFGTIGDVVYVVAGGPTGGTAWSAVNEAFSFTPQRPSLPFRAFLPLLFR